MVNYDDEFAGLLQNVGNLVPFFDAFFGFLYRRTDFFCIRDATEDSKIGFMEGSAEKLVISVFRRWQQHAANELDNAAKLKASAVPPVAAEVEVESENKSELILDVQNGKILKLH